MSKQWPFISNFTVGKGQHQSQVRLMQKWMFELGESLRFMMKLHKKQSKTSSCAGRSPDVHKGAVLSGRLVKLKSNVVADLLRSVLAFY